jgi:hypothetical protein
MFDAKVIECAKCCTGKVAKLWVISFGLKLSDDCDRNNDLMLFEFVKCAGVSQKNAGI